MNNRDEGIIYSPWSMKGYYAVVKMGLEGGFVRRDESIKKM